MIKKLKNDYSTNARKKRGEMFLSALKPQQGDKIIDLGGGNGVHIHQIIGNAPDLHITISDISEKSLQFARERLGYHTALLDESGCLQFAENEFDIVFCNSVIEHVTLPKEKIWTEMNTKRFEELSLSRQREFAAEVRRIGKSYFVQTPNKYFLIESHTWLPGLIALMPRKWQIQVIRFFNRFWPKKTAPDFHLLTYKEMKELFPDAKIIREKSFGMTKSFIAVKNNG